MDYAPLILVVEDNQANRELLREIMEDCGYRVNEAVNGKDAVDKARQEIPDLILMDLEMPVMNGNEAIKILMRENETSRTPIIVLTGLNDMADRIKAFDSGAMDYVNKPFDTHELMAHVRSYLRFSLLNKKYVLSTISHETQLPNRAAFREKLEECVRPQLFLMKLDGLEAISRFYGEATRADIERSFSGFIQKQCLGEFANGAHLFHLDHGLFGLLADDPDNILSTEKKRHFAESVQECYKNHQFIIRDVHHDLALIIVISSSREFMPEKTELAVDEAVYRKSGILIAEDIIDDVYRKIGENIFWIQQIRAALREDRFIPFFQPIMNNMNGKIEKYESLIRLKDDQGKIVPPGLFLPIAKNSRYYHDITRIVLLKSMDIFKSRPEQFSVNLSALDIEDPAMQKFLLQTLERMPETASRLTFEIVEQEGFHHIFTIREFIKQVKQYGVKIAMDDFGSGYSNFRTLIDMDIDYLKIDGSLIKNIHTDTASFRVVETIQSFAEKISLKIIAEFVENKEIFNCLKQMGIHYSQGYFIGKPDKL